MSNTYSQITIQIVFAVKGRENILRDEFRADLFKYINGIVKGKNQVPLAVNGWKDHVHALFGLSPSVSVSDMARDIKANSSKWINDNGLVKGKFNWQDGFGAFSYSRSQRDDVIQLFDRISKITEPIRPGRKFKRYHRDKRNHYVNYKPVRNP